MIRMINNGRLTGMSQEGIKADVLSHMIVYVEAKNSFDNNMDHPQNGSIWTDSFSNDIVAFILGNDIKDWTEIPDAYVLDDIERKNFIHFIKWNDNKEKETTINDTEDYSDRFNGSRK